MAISLILICRFYAALGALSDCINTLLKTQILGGRGKIFKKCAVFPPFDYVCFSSLYYNGAHAIKESSYLQYVFKKF